jgi:hypothetical protein
MAPSAPHAGVCAGVSEREFKSTSLRRSDGGAPLPKETDTETFPSTCCEDPSAKRTWVMASG